MEVVNEDGNNSSSERVQFDEGVDEDPGGAQSYKDRCYMELKDDVFLKSLIDILFLNNCLNDFMLLVKQLANKSLPVTNIAFLLCLERAKWQSLVSTGAV